MDQDPLVDIAADLYALPPEDFVPARDDAVKRAKQAGDKRLATAVGKLRKPTVGAWAVNLLAHERPDLVDDLLELGEELRSAQRNLRGDDLRDLSLRRRKLISELARTAVSLARRRNLPVPEIEATFTAALADEEVAAAVRVGVLAKTVEYAGFGETPRPQLRLLQGGAAADVAAIDVGLSSPARTKKVGPDSPASISDAQRKRAERERAEKEAAERQRAEREAAERAKREAEEQEAAELAERRAAERDEARRQSAELKRARAAAHRELLAARTELSEAEAARVAAERAVTAAKRRVEKATATVNALDM